MVKYVIYSTAYQLSLWLSVTSTVALVLVTRVRIAFTHEFFQFLFFYCKLRFGLGSVMIARFKVHFTVTKIYFPLSIQNFALAPAFVCGSAYYRTKTRGVRLSKNDFFSVWPKTMVFGSVSVLPN